MLSSNFLRTAATAALAVALACFAQPPVIAGKPVGREVEVARARKGAVERTTTVPGSLIADQSARLFAKVSGYLKQLNVDIGDEVKAGDVLAVIDVPELAKEVEHNAAAYEQAESKVLQAKARLASAEADRLAADARLSKDRASLEDAEAILVFRKQIYERLKRLADERPSSNRSSTRNKKNTRPRKPRSMRPRQPSAAPRQILPRQTPESRWPKPTSKTPKRTSKSGGPPGSDRK